jgi:amino acid adenylation domain-containing protein
MRVEIGEIEAVMSSHPGIKEVAVQPRDDERGGKLLVAYVVWDARQEPDSDKLRGYLKEKLPSHMVPSFFVTLEKLPLMPNGKVDRRALPEPESGLIEPKRAFTAPRSPLEDVVAEVWSQVLGIKKIGIHDNFFDLGGHSLTATQVMSRIRQMLQVELPLRRLFERPTVESLAAYIDQARQEGEGLQAPPIVPVSRGGQSPLSFAQQRLWFLDQFQPGSPFYNIPTAVRFKGALNSPALEQGLTEICRRHEVLRTTFPSVDGDPVQRVSEIEPIRMTLADFGAVAADMREAMAESLIAREAQRAFDLARGPLIRATVLRLDEQDYVFLLTIHHIVTDGWSLRILMQELAKLYEACRAGQGSPLSELPIQYADFASWQREWLQGEVLEGQLKYWKEQFADATAALALPSDRPHPAVQSFRGASQSVLLPERLLGPLKLLGRKQGVTLFMTVLAAFQTLLHRYSGQDDITVGTPVAGRNRAETSGLIGLFANTLVMRVNVTGNPSFIELLSQVREVALNAYMHQDLPFEKLVEVLQPERALSHNPLFQVLLALHNISMSPVDLPDLSLRQLKPDTLTARFDLSLDLHETPAGLLGSIEYSTDLFEASTITRMMGNFENLLAAIAERPERPVSFLPLLTQSELQYLTTSWSGSRIESWEGRDSALHELFEAQAERIPDAVAAGYEDEQVSFACLNRRANQLARHLNDAGVSQESLVGVYIERSLEMLTSLLGVLKAGGAYLPIDPIYPPDRVAFMLEDARARVLVTGGTTAQGLTESRVRVVSMDADWDAISTRSDLNPANMVTPANLAYVIYTSGSTGNPKGVQVSHGSAVHLLKTTGPAFDFSEEDVWSCAHSFSFDFSVWELWTPLIHGSRLMIVPRQVSQSTESFCRLIDRDQVTVLNQTPTAINSLVQHRQDGAERGRHPALRLVICGGEALGRELSQRLSSWGVPVWNFYGPTEATVWAAAGRVDSEAAYEGYVPIGRPLADTRLLSVDTYMQPVPLGAPGELCIGGEGVARGYLNRPELTAEKFVPDPFAAAAGERLYRTGDLVRFLANGDTEFVGRTDNQVKLRGFRIELGEIEAALGQYPGVIESVVTTHEDRAKGRILVAYLVTDQEGLPAAGEIRSFLKKRLPVYMVPSAYVVLEEFPLTANGKLDRKRLPKPEQDRLSPQGAVATPARPEEEILAGIFAQVLGIDEVGVDDNFFDLGGHSLLATQAISRVRQAFGVELELRRLFETPTVRGLIEGIEAARQGGGAKTAPVIERAERNRPLPLSFAQQRLWFLDQLEPGTSLYNIPVALRLRGHINLAVLEQSFAELARRHEVLRTVFSTVQGAPVQIIKPFELLALPVVDLQGLPEAICEAEVARLTSDEASRPFDLGVGPLLRLRLVRVKEQDCSLLLTLHHVVCDAWSTGIVVKEITAISDAFSGGQPSSLEELKIQYADFAAWEQSWLTGSVLESHLSYWKRQLQGNPPVLELPGDRPRQAMPTYRGASQPFDLSAGLTESLKALSRREGVTLFMTMLAAFKVLLHRYTEESDILIGANIANRNRGQIEELIGFFVNMLVLRTDLSSDPTFRELLKQVREATLEAYAHQDLPFEKVVEQLQPGRELSQSPLFRIVFNFDNTPHQPGDMGGLPGAPLTPDFEHSRFDLTLLMSEAAGRLQGAWKYSADLFNAATIDRMLGHFVILLHDIAARPDARIGSLELLTDAEKQEKAEQKREWEESNVQLLMSIKRKSIRLKNELS